MENVPENAICREQAQCKGCCSSKDMGLLQKPAVLSGG
jgi:hypothetical protein